MNDEHQWKGSGGLRHPHPGLQRHVRRIEAPVLSSQPPLQACPVPGDPRAIYRVRYETHLGAVLGAVLVVPAAIGKVNDAIGPGGTRIGKGKSVVLPMEVGERWIE